MIATPDINNNNFLLNPDVGEIFNTELRTNYEDTGYYSNSTYSKHDFNEIENSDTSISGDNPISRNTDAADQTYSYGPYRWVEVLTHFVSTFARA